MKKLNTELPCDPTIPLLLLKRNFKTATQKLHLKVSAALFIIAKMLKQPKCPELMKEQVKRGVSIQWSIDEIKS